MTEAAVLLPYQNRWCLDRSPVKIIEKSRRIGLSYAEASDSVLHAGAASGANVYYISYDKEMTQGFIQDCADWARRYHAGAGVIDESVIQQEDRQILTYEIKFDSGHKIQTFSSNPRNLRSKGRPGERLVIDEAAFVDDLEELLKAAMAMTMWGGHIRIISTHNGEENAFNGLINDVRAGRFDYSLHRVTLDDAIADGLYRKICEVSGQTWSLDAELEWREALVRRYRPNEDEELFCVPRLGGGAYLTRALIEACMAPAPVIRFEGSREFNELPEPMRAAEMDDWIRDEVRPLLTTLRQDRRHALGMDFARKGHMSVLAPMEIGSLLERTVPFLVGLHNVPHKQQEQVLCAIGDGLPRLCGVSVDATGPGSFIAEAATDHFGSLVDEVHLSEAWYREQMPRYKARFEDRTLMIPKSDDVLEAHRAFRLVRGVARLPDNTTDKEGQSHGDEAMAIVLAHAASERDAGPVEFTPAVMPNAWRGESASDGDDDDRPGSGLPFGLTGTGAF